MVRIFIAIKDIICRSIEHFLRLKRKKIILFVVRNEIMFSYAYEVYKLLENDVRLSLWFCFATPAQCIDLQKIKKRHRIRSIHYFFAKKINWDLILYPDHQQGFLEQCPKIYIGHGLNSGKLVDGQDYVFSKGAYDETGCMIYQKIFRHSEFVAQSLIQRYPQFKAKVKVVGSLTLDGLEAVTVDKDKELKLFNFDISKKTILIVSTWGAHSLIQSRGEEVLSELPDILKDYNVILSLHLNNFTNAYYRSAVDWKSAINAVEGIAGFYFVKPGESSYRLLPLADLMVTDMTSLGLYYTILKRPIIYYKHPDERLGAGSLITELQKVAPVVNELKGLRSKIERGFKDFDVSRLDRFTQEVFSFYGQAWMRHKEEIYDSLSLTAKE